MQNRQLKALIVGGCPQPWHRLEAAEPPLRAALESLGLEARFSGIYHPDGGADFVGDYAALNASTLQVIDLLVLYTTGAEHRGADVGAILDFVRNGKALVGIHNAADSFMNDPEYTALIGARFRHHPAQFDIATEVVDPSHPIMQGVGAFTVHDELYLFTDYDPANVHLLAQTRSVDDNGPVPIAWTREPGQGRVFYLSLGHNADTLSDANWQRLFKNGVEWALRRI
jgi:type 1 glutamine amidotransferase